DICHASMISLTLGISDFFGIVVEQFVVKFSVAVPPEYVLDEPARVRGLRHRRVTDLGELDARSQRLFGVTRRQNPGLRALQPLDRVIEILQVELPTLLLTALALAAITGARVAVGFYRRRHARRVVLLLVMICD